MMDAHPKTWIHVHPALMGDLLIYSKICPLTTFQLTLSLWMDNKHIRKYSSPIEKGSNEDRKLYRSKQAERGTKGKVDV